MVSGVVGSPESGRSLIRATAKGPSNQAVSIGRELADKLIAKGAKEILGEVRG
jgi:porphobilinogen deaminase